VTESTGVEAHLTPEQTARYLDGVLTRSERGEAQSHLAACRECRMEVAALSRIAPRRPSAWLRRVGVGAGEAAAAALLLFVRTGSVPPPEPSSHRDPAPGAASPIQPVSPLGAAGPPTALVWSRVGAADQYRVTVFDAEGSILFRAATADSAVALPDSVRFAPGRSYFWKVEGDTGWDRWVSSPLTEFSVEAEPPGR
jgi:anti-sigma factor RsiW